jgi:hypothetical protein
MVWVRKLLFNLKVRFKKDKVEKELGEELQFHLERLVEKNIFAGMAQEQAHEDARLQVGNFQEIKELVLRELFLARAALKIDTQGRTMNPFKVNYWAVLVAAMIYCSLGAMWHSGFRDSALLPSRFVTALVGAAVLSYTLAVLLNYTSSSNAREGCVMGAVVGSLLGLGIAITTIVTSNTLAGRPMELCPVEPLSGMAAIGAIVGSWKKHEKSPLGQLV